MYAFFARWRDAGLVAELHDRLREAVRDAEGRDREPSAAVIDSQSVKADATVALTSRGFDAGEKVNGRKWHLLTDTLGLLLAVLVTPTSTTDRDAARSLLPVARGRFGQLARVWADGGAAVWPGAGPVPSAGRRPERGEHSRPRLERKASFHQSFRLGPKSLDLRRDRLKPQGRSQLLAPHAFPARLRLQYGHDPLVVRRQGRCRHPLGPSRHHGPRHRAPHRLHDRTRRLGQHLGHRHTRIRKTRKRAFRLAECGLHPLGLLPQPRDLFPDLLLPGLQQTEHRRHQPPPQAR
ncbi:hypothetical protein E3E14_20205 [Streptomyces sp. ICN441]|nr:hypothetical protein E3E14_20205 [Streptomyces sp. ICN441]